MVAIVVYLRPVKYWITTKPNAKNYSVSFAETFKSQSEHSLPCACLVLYLSRTQKLC